MERLLLFAAAFCFLVSFGHTLFALGAGAFRPARFNLLAMSGGFLTLTAFLYLRGRQVGACPLTNLFEVLVFLSWSIALIYLLIGPAYQLSLMGAFTAPLVLVLLLFGLVVPSGPVERRGAVNSWVEFHAALSLIAYGAFALACISGVMYLVQERQLKGRRASGLLYNLPAIHDLNDANGRLIVTGFSLLSVAFGAGLAAGLPVANPKFWAAFLIWLLYGVLMVLRRLRTLAPRRLAALSIVVFVLALGSLPAIQYFSVLKP